MKFKIQLKYRLKFPKNIFRNWEIAILVCKLCSGAQETFTCSNATKETPAILFLVLLLLDLDR